MTIDGVEGRKRTGRRRRRATSYTGMRSSIGRKTEYRERDGEHRKEVEYTKKIEERREPG
jgi:hypothetical protein